MRVRVLAVLVVGFVATACAAKGPEIELVGTRADGLAVVCAVEGDPDDARYACEPQPRDDVGESRGASAADGCASWSDGGPAIVLWPPNHKQLTVTLDECARVRGACGGARATSRAGKIVAVTSDEPLDARGDGNTAEGDLVIIGERAVLLRSERQGGGDGRVYRIESRDAEGHADVCEVHVPHDRGPFGGAHNSGELVRITAP